MKKYRIVFVLLIVLLLIIGYFKLKEVQQKNFTYTDKTYGYMITFPGDWKDVKVISDLSENQTFALPTIDTKWVEYIGPNQESGGYASVFFLRRITLSDWVKMRKACGERGGQSWEVGCLTDSEYLGKNNSYYFTAFYPSVLPNDSAWISRSHEISEEYLKNNFKIIDSK
jgi:hypothetical protein